MNNQIYAQRHALMIEANEIHLGREGMSRAWYHSAYPLLRDCNQFIQLTENYDDNTVSETIAIYKSNLQRE